MIDPAGAWRSPLRARRPARGTPAENAKAIRAVLLGETGPRRDAILLNAAGAIAAAGHASDLADGLRIASESVDSGAAAERLEELTAFSRAVAA